MEADDKFLKELLDQLSSAVSHIFQRDVQTYTRNNWLHQTSTLSSAATTTSSTTSANEDEHGDSVGAVHNHSFELSPFLASALTSLQSNITTIFINLSVDIHDEFAGLLSESLDQSLMTSLLRENKFKHADVKQVSYDLQRYLFPLVKNGTGSTKPVQELMSR